MPMKRRTALSLIATLPAAGHLLARTRWSITYGYTPVTDFASVFVAADQGFFSARGIDIELKLIPLNSTIPAAIEAGSLQLGGPTPSVFLQAVDGGLDQVAVAGGSVTSKAFTGFGLVARAGSGIQTAQHCVGRKIGVPGLGAFLHITFRAWLASHGVDHKRVTFVEAPFPQHNDLLRGGAIDAVVTGDPFMSRITDSGVGYVASYYTTFLPEGESVILHAARRDWVQANPLAVRAFREAVQQGARFVALPANDAAVRSIIGKHIRLPAEVLARIQISRPGPAITPAQLRYWVGLMQAQDMLKQAPDVARLVAP